MGKYDDLNRIQKLKEDGIITEEEFEVEKKKILNNSEYEKGSNKKINLIKILYRVLFGMAIIAIISTIIFIFLYMPYEEDDGSILDYLNAQTDVEVDYYANRITKSEYERKLKEIDKEEQKKANKESFISDGRFVSGGIAIGSVVLGIIFFVVQKRTEKKEKI